MSKLTPVNRSGDCHGSNNILTDGPYGTSLETFFEFDDAGPGWLAPELSLYLWVILLRMVDGELGSTVLERWCRYIPGYCSVRLIGSGDFDAINAVLAVRQCWLMGEYTGRVAVWSIQPMPTSRPCEQVDLLRAWVTL